MALCVVSLPPRSSASVPDTLWSTPAHECRGKRSRSAEPEFALDITTSSPSRLYNPTHNPSPRDTKRRAKHSPCPTQGASVRCSLRIDVAATRCVEARASTCVERPSSRSPTAPSSGPTTDSSAEPTSPCSSVASRGCVKSALKKTPSRSVKRRRLRFDSVVKVHDGLCCPNRIFDELVWEQVTTYNIGSGDDVVRIVRRHLALEQEAALRAGARLPRDRASSAASTDSDDSGCDRWDVPTLPQALTRLQQQTLDLGSRIAEAERTAAASADVSVPVLPRGGGLAAKLTPRHLRLVLRLAEMVQEALEDTLTGSLLSGSLEHGDSDEFTE